MKTNVFYTSSSEETKKIAADLASSFKGGEVILAYGDMGAGKTAFCQGLGIGLGVKGIVNSPTFNLIKVYNGTKFNLYHVDCYRLENVDEERKDLGLSEIIGDEKNITYIEWPIYASNDILTYHPIIEVHIEYIDEEKRKITIKDERQ